MVEIIRRGELPENKWFEYTCRNCQTQFKFQKHEARLSPDQRDGGYFIPCPLCRQNCWMTSLQSSTSISSRSHNGYWDR